MSSQTLHISIIQPDIIWENKEAYLVQYEQYLASLGEKREVVLLPEMFTTGFSMNPEALAEPMDGTTVNWMKQMAARYRCILAGSVIIREEDKYFNRLIWMQPDGQFGHYDKRHLFAFAGEDASYSCGVKRLIVSVKGWKICLAVCYDLRFPVWLRNQQEEYDAMIIVANWPERRVLAWNTLLQARAIENQSYVVGVNRVGTDGDGHKYPGSSHVFDPLGAPLLEAGDKEGVYTCVLEKETLVKTREGLPFLKDADRFMIL